MQGGVGGDPAATTFDHTQAKVREQLAREGLASIVAKLERIDRTREEFDWRFDAVEVLGGGKAESEATRESDLVGSREGDDEDDEDDELLDFAENLMDELAEVWQDEE